MSITLTLTLTPDIEQALTEQARDCGTTPEILALEVLRERFVAWRAQEAPEDSSRSLADFLDGHIGVLKSSEHVPGGARMSEDGGRKFAEALLEKRLQTAPRSS